MTPDEVDQRVAAVNELYRTADNDKAHIAEDDLWEDPENSRWYS